MRKHFFVNEENGYLTKEQRRQQPTRNPMTGINDNRMKISSYDCHFRPNNDD
jgi:hypothetical protein